MPGCDLCNEQFSDHRAAWHHIHYGHEIPQGEVTSHIVDSPTDEQAAASAPSATSSSIFGGGGKAPAILLAHWNHLIDGLQTSSLGFYEALDQALRRRGVPDASGHRVDYREAGLLSAKREYLRVTRGAQAVDICAAPFGSGFFVSWWMGEARPGPFVPTIAALALIVAVIRSAGLWFGPLIIFGSFFFVGAVISLGEAPWHPYVFVVPVLGPLWERLFRPLTLYRHDTMLMFKKAIHQAVLEVVDSLTDAQGIRRLSENERKPILRDFWRR
jgi:hypothetical protein